MIHLSIAILMAWTLAASADITKLDIFENSHPRILIVSPHPDDDVLGASGIMKATVNRKAQGKPADLLVVYMTMGDSYGQALFKEKVSGRSKTFAELGEERHKEALNSLQAVGVGPDQAVFLAYPDQGLFPLFSYRSTKSQGKLYTSPATLASKVPYSFAAHPGREFRRDNVIQDLTNIIRTFKPTVIFTPTLTDVHPDHKATREFVSEALERMKSKIPHYEFLIHWELLEDGWPQTDADWRAPDHHAPADFEFKLADANWTAKEKEKVISLHDSQTAIDGVYLRGFAKSSELFWRTRPTMGDYLKKE